MEDDLAMLYDIHLQDQYQAVQADFEATEPYLHRLKSPHQSLQKSQVKQKEEASEIHQDNDQIYGPSGSGDYAQHNVIQFSENGVIRSGTIIHCTRAGTTASGRFIPLTYEVDCGDGFPHIVNTAQIIQTP